MSGRKIHHFAFRLCYEVKIMWFLLVFLFLNSKQNVTYTSFVCILDLCVFAFLYVCDSVCL